MNRREFIAALGAAAAWPPAGRAQQSAIPLVGFVSGRSPFESAYLVAAFRRGLAENGRVEGQNVAVEYRWAEGDVSRVPAIAGELLERPVAALVTVGGAARAVVTSIKNVPVVFTDASDPIESGLVTSLNRPSGNATGVTVFTSVLEPKRLEIVQEIAPGAPIAVLVNPNSYSAARRMQDIQDAARALRVHIHVLQASSEREIHEAFRKIGQLRPGALLVAAEPYFNSRRDQLVLLSAHYGVPALYHAREFVTAGGLMSYGSSVADAYRRVGIYLAKILDGAKPGELPVEQPTKFELVINLKTAKALGLDVPATLLARADEVIE